MGVDELKVGFNCSGQGTAAVWRGTWQRGPLRCLAGGHDAQSTTAMRPRSGYRWQPPCQSAAAVVSHRVGVASNEMPIWASCATLSPRFPFLLFLAEQARHSASAWAAPGWASYTVGRDGPAGCCGLPDGCEMRSKDPFLFPGWNSAPAAQMVGPPRWYRRRT